MSKNFELLQQLGNCEELFGTSTELAGDPSRIDAEAGQKVDKAERDRILKHASLPDVLGAAGGVSTAAFDSTVGEAEKGRDEFLPISDVFPRKSDPTTAPSGSKHAARAVDLPAAPCEQEKRIGMTEARQGLVSSGGEAAHGRTPTLPDVIPEPSREAEVKSRSGAGRNSVTSQWIESVRTAAKAWRKEPRRWNRGDRVDTEAIFREEEIKLVQRVFPEGAQDSPRVALFSSIEGEPGGAAICARTAEILAARGEGPVCVVDANFGSPSLHRYFGVENDRGLAEAARELGPIHGFVRQIPEPDLWLLPSGKTSAELSFPAIAEGLRARIFELKGAFRRVVIHAGLLRRETSGMLMSRWTDGVVLILEANSTRRDTAKRAKEILRAANVDLLGIVLNNRRFPIPEAIYRRL